MGCQVWSSAVGSASHGRALLCLSQAVPQIPTGICIYSWNPSGMGTRGSNSTVVRPKSRNIFSGLCKKPRVPIVGVPWQRPQGSDSSWDTPALALNSRSFGKEGKKELLPLRNWQQRSKINHRAEMKWGDTEINCIDLK